MVVKNRTLDYIVNMGPEGGAGGREMIAKGTPEEIVKVKNSSTGKYLKDDRKQKK